MTTVSEKNNQITSKLIQLEKLLHEIFDDGNYCLDYRGSISKSEIFAPDISNIENKGVIIIDSPELKWTREVR